jgi:hypothetical protein
MKIFSAVLKLVMRTPDVLSIIVGVVPITELYKLKFVMKIFSPDLPPAGRRRFSGTGQTNNRTTYNLTLKRVLN